MLLGNILLWALLAYVYGTITLYGLPFQDKFDFASEGEEDAHTPHPL